MEVPWSPSVRAVRIGSVEGAVEYAFRSIRDVAVLPDPTAGSS